MNRGDVKQIQKVRIHGNWMANLTARVVFRHGAVLHQVRELLLNHSLGTRVGRVQRDDIVTEISDSSQGTKHVSGKKKKSNAELDMMQVTWSNHTWRRE
jgi:hypothetical protein